MKEKFVQDDFHVPESFETNRIRLRMLSVEDAEKDYDAVTSSIDHLQKSNVFGPDNTWPASDISYERDVKDLAWHQKEFEQRSSFAYTVMNLDEEQCVGCVYIYPSTNKAYDAQVMLWVRESELENGLDSHLFDTVKKWIMQEWPFENPGYPGRDIDWITWKSSN